MLLSVEGQAGPGCAAIGKQSLIFYSSCHRPDGAGLRGVQAGTPTSSRARPLQAQPAARRPPPAERAPLTRPVRLQPERGGDHEQQGQEAVPGSPRLRAAAAGTGHHGPAGRQLGRLGLPSAGAAPPLPGPRRLLRGCARRRDWARGGPAPNPIGAARAGRRGRLPPRPARPGPRRRKWRSRRLRPARLEACPELPAFPPPFPPLRLPRSRGTWARGAHLVARPARAALGPRPPQRAWARCGRSRKGWACPRGTRDIVMIG